MCEFGDSFTDAINVFWIILKSLGLGVDGLRVVLMSEEVEGEEAVSLAIMGNEQSVG